MTTISPSRHKAPWRGYLKVGGLLLLILVVFFLRAPLSGALWRLAAPIVAWRNAIDATQNAQLEAELASTTAALADRNTLFAENELLKSQFGRNASGSGILAVILQRPPGVPYDTLMIDAGTEEGIAKGDLVSAGGTTLIGTVSEAYPSTAQVTLFSSPGQTYEALIGGTIPVSIEGQGGGSMEGEVPAQTPVTLGEPVFFPSITNNFTGDVTDIEAPTSQSFETVYIELPVNFFSLRYVLVLNP